MKPFRYLAINIFLHACSLWAQPLVSTIDGDITVTNRGNAVYEIPINVLPGVSGMEPELGIVYDSSGGNGVMGMGFSLKGMSSIRRVPANLEQDGFIDGVDFDQNDRYVLDGQRLVVLGADLNYGLDGSEYRTEIETFQKVIAHGQRGSGPEYFTVQTKSGLTMTFGQSRNSALNFSYEGDEHTLNWSLDSIVDASRNRVEYHYTIDAENQQLLDKIVYGFSDLNPNGIYEIRFEYEANAYPNKLFILGNEVLADERLSGMSCLRVGGVDEIWSYKLEYTIHENQTCEKLSSLVGLSGSQEFGRLSFNWGSEVSGDRFFSLSKKEVTLNENEAFDTGYGVTPSIFELPFLHAREISGADLTQGLGRFDPRNGDTVFALSDFNGDSIIDYILKQSSVELPEGYSLPLYESDLAQIGFDHQNWQTLELYKGGLEGFQYQGKIESSYDTRHRIDVFGVANKHSVTSALIDMNGDGYPDRVKYKSAYDAADPLFYYPNGIVDQSGLYVSLNNKSGAFLDSKLWFTSEVEEQCYVKWKDEDGNVFSQLLDINGDGLPDKIDHMQSTTEESGIWVSINNGSGFNLQEKWLGNPLVLENRLTWVQPRDGSILSQFLDINGDGLVDRVHYLNYENYEIDLGVWVNFNNGHGFDSDLVLWHRFNKDEQNKPVWSFSSGDGNSLVRSSFFDINGDGLPDKVHSYNYDSGESGIWVSLNTGTGFSMMRDWGYSTTHFYQEHVSWSYKGSQLSGFIDINGDGLLDRYDHYNYSEGAFGSWISLNTGSQFLPPVKWLDSNNENQNRLTWGSHVDGQTSQPQKNSNRSEFRDMNGDGFLDRIHGQHPDTGETGLYVNESKLKPILLQSITNNFGEVTMIEYKPLSDPSVYLKEKDSIYPIVDIQNALRVVSAVSKDSGIFDSEGNPILYRTEYTYAGARNHAHGRGFLGFRVFETYDTETGLTTTETLAQNFPYTGMKLASATYGRNGQMLSRSENQLDAKSLNDGKTLYPFYAVSEEWKAEFDTSTSYASMDEAALVADLKAEAYGHTTTTNDFDAHGNNIRLEIDYGDGYSQLTESWFTRDDETTWQLGRLTRSVVTSNAPAVSGRSDVQVVRESTFTYDSDGLLETETVEPGDALSVTTSYLRDDAGRVYQTVVDPADETAVTTETLSQLDATRRFYEKTANALGHGETRSYDPVRGWLNSQTGPNGRTTQFDYNSLGRPVREDRPDGTWNETSYAYDDSQTVVNPISGVTLQSVYRVTATGSQSPTENTWYDRLGREIRTSSEDYNGQVVYKDIAYNVLGQADCVSDPYYAGGAPLWTKTTYDDLGRPVDLIAPDGTVLRTIYNGRETTRIRNFVENGSAPNENQATVTVKNAKGDTATVTSFNDNGQPLVLTYHYDGVGNLLETVKTSPSAGSSTVAMFYDIRGNKERMEDPDMGEWEYDYNALGQLVWQQDAVGNITTKDYDDLGRVVSETSDAADPGVATVTRSLYYDGTDEFQQIGKLHLEKSSGGFRRSHYYDDLGREFLTLSKIEGRWFYQQTDYDDFSRPVRLTHYWRPPSLADNNQSGDYDHHLAWYSYSQEKVYNKRSFVTEVKDANGETWWHSPTYDVFGQLTSYYTGNGLKTIKTYEADRRVIDRIRVEGMGSAILDHAYDFDALGNVESRADLLKGLSESFTYDRLNRLRSAQVAGQSEQGTDYDDFGNITSRSGVGAYTYDPLKKHSVTDAGNRSYAYDANGAITTINGPNSGSIEWTAFSKPRHMEVGNHRSSFGYDTGNNRVTQTREAYNFAEEAWETKSRKTYVGSLFEQEQVWNQTGTKWQIASTRIYISTPDGVVGSWMSDQEEGLTRTYVHRDHLGSIIAESGGDIADTATYGKITQAFSYDAWGNARSATDWTAAESPDRKATDRGYTGHEMLDALGLVHMNGRIYDPYLGRMLSADPFVQEPGNFQNYNRYSYVVNNPLSMTDPSGHFFGIIAAIVSAVVSSAVAIASVIISTVSGALTGVGAFLASASVKGLITTGFLVYGGVSSYKAGGLRGLAMFAVAGAVTAGIGGYFDGLQAAASGIQSGIELARATAHGIAQGGFAEISGGDFGDGFMAAFSGSIAGSMIASKSGSGSFFGSMDQGGKYLVRRTIASSVVSGTVTEIGGGKFANGAVTGAMGSILGEIGRGQTKAKGEWIFPEGGSTDINDYNTAITNGIRVSRKDFITDLAGYNGTAVGFYNPTGGSIADILESGLQKFGFGSGDGLASNFAAKLSTVDHPITIIAHSQGTLTVVNAQFRYGLPAGSHFEFRSPVVTYARAAAAASSNGGTFKYGQPFGDVANLLAPSVNPIKIGSGLLDIPNGFGTHSANGL